MKIFIVLIFCLIKSFAKSNFSRGRTLIFPPTAPTRAQLICGIGVPLDLELEGMTTGYVLKAEYFLPTTADELQSTKLHSQPINRRDMLKQHWTNSQKSTKKTNIFKLPEYVTMERSKYRWSIYKSAEKVLRKLGFSGKECFLRSICEVSKAAVNFESGLLGELLYILITPTTSRDKYYKSIEAYLHAENKGKLGDNCSYLFQHCKKYLLEFLSVKM